MTESIKPVVHVIDDDESLRTALARLLAAVGHGVRTYAGAGDFLLNWHDDGPGCILLDVSMPGGPSGLGLQRALTRRVDALPVVFLTGHGDIGMGVEAMKAGAVDFLTKPVDRDALLGAVHAALERDHECRTARAKDRYARRRSAMLAKGKRSASGVGPTRSVLRYRTVAASSRSSASTVWA